MEFLIHPFGGIKDPKNSHEINFLEKKRQVFKNFDKNIFERKS